MWWLAHGEHEVPSSLDWLSPPEREHVDSIRFTKRRDEYLTRRWTAKQAIATVLDIDRAPEALTRIEVRHRPSGAPHVHLDGRAAGVDISMSDRAGWAVCLVGPAGSAESGTLGIDLEVVEPRSDEFVADFFTAAERAHVRALGDLDLRHEAANLIWSAKEAALKVQQVGLRVDTRTVDVQLRGERRPDGWAPMNVSAAAGPMPGWWRRDGVFVLTIAYDTHREPPELLPTGSSLAAAAPVHSWVHRPTC
jgi:4'-phosphopantetheinyl transferase